MLSDHSILVLSLSVLGLALLAAIVGLAVHYGYTLPNFFYGDWVALSTTDAAGKTWWAKNDKGTFTFVKDASDASVVRFYPGPTGTTGQLFESSTSFELFHPYRGAYFTASCQAGKLAPKFATTTGSQLVVDGANNPLRDGGQYRLTLQPQECRMANCATSGCDVSGCSVCVVEGTELAAQICCDAGASTLWTLTKVNNIGRYAEYKTTKFYQDPSGN